MKKIAAIFFVILFSFNWFGYRLMYNFMEKKANQQLEASLDNHEYDESQLMELKVPVHLPYQINWSSYKRYNGEITLNGVKYNYVERKLANDTLYLKCIANTEDMRLQSAKNDFFRLSNNLLQNSNQKKTTNENSVFKNLQPVYNESSLGMHIYFPFALSSIAWIPLKPALLLSGLHLSPEQPPDAAMS